MTFAKLNSKMLHYDWCPGEGVPIVFIHEMGGTLDSWSLVRNQLPGRATLAIDLCGFGLSEKPVGPVVIGDHVLDVVSLIEHIGVSNVHLVGGAVGGGIAIATAAALGERASRLTALAPATGIPTERRVAVRELADMFAREGVRDFILSDTIPNAWPAEIFERTGPGYELFLATQFSTPPESLAATYRMLVDLDLESDLASLTCPSTFVAGTHDKARTPVLVRQIAKKVQGSRFLEISSGHFMALQTPKIVAELLT